MCRTLFVKNYVKPTTVNMAEEKVAKMRTLLTILGVLIVCCAVTLVFIQAFYCGSVLLIYVVFDGLLA